MPNAVMRCRLLCVAASRPAGAIRIYVRTYALILLTRRHPILRFATTVRATTQTTVAQLVRDTNLDADLVMSTEPVDESIGANVVASRGEILPLELVDFEHAELASLTCEELLARFIPDPTDAILEVMIVHLQQHPFAHRGRQAGVLYAVLDLLW